MTLGMEWVDECVESVGLEAGDLVLDAVLLLRVARADQPDVAFAIGRSKGCDWIVQCGLVAAASTILGDTDGITRRDD